MITIKEAAQQALGFYKDIYPETTGVLVEEVELDSDRQNWLITLSFPVEKESQSPLAAALGNKFDRKYKTFKIDSTTGEVTSMKIRVLEV